MEDPKQLKEQTKKTAIETAKEWGGEHSFPYASSNSDICGRPVYLLNLLTESPLPSSILATLVFAQHARPLQAIPMIFPPLLLFSTYLNLQGYKVDSAGTTAAFSGLYLVLAGRRRNPFMSKFGVRGIIRGATMGLCLANVVGGGLAYMFGSRSKEDEKQSTL